MSDEGGCKSEQLEKSEEAEEKKGDAEGQEAKAPILNPISVPEVDDKPAENKPQSDNHADKTDETPSQDFAAYEEHMTYGADGGAIYTDPSTKQKYKWCATGNNWQPLGVDEDVDGQAEDPYENEHYKWCPKSQQWLPKKQETETEHYKWDDEQKKWVPKHPNPGQEGVCGVDEHGERTYTDKDGVEFFWDATKSAWFPKIDDDFMARYQMNYGFIDNTSAGEKEKAEKEAAEAKRKEEELKRMTAEAEAAMSRDNPASSAAVPTGKRKAQEPPSTRYSTFRLISYDF